MMLIFEVLITQILLHLGYKPGIYPMDELKADYKKGLVVAISFCVFVMPLLLPKPDATEKLDLLDKKYNEDPLSLDSDSVMNEKNAVQKTDHPDSVDNGNTQDKISDEDVVDGPYFEAQEFISPYLFPDIAKERLIDGIKEVLDEQHK